MNTELWPWLALGLLGLYHGINPAMGWLFAVALGMQEGSQRAVKRALVPIALGHAAAISVAVVALASATLVVPQPWLRTIAAVIVFAFGAYKLFRSRHPRWAAMRVGFRDLTLWSFLMASAHGAGLMLVPILLAWPAPGMLHAHDASLLHHAHTVPALDSSVLQNPSLLVAAIGLHTATLLLATGVLALLFYRKLSLALLRRTWFNFDLLWAFSLFSAGLLTLLW